MCPNWVRNYKGFYQKKREKRKRSDERRKLWPQTHLEDIKKDVSRVLWDTDAGHRNQDRAPRHRARDCRADEPLNPPTSKGRLPIPGNESGHLELRS